MNASIARIVVAAAAVAVAVPLTGPASARCPEDNVACQTAAQACAVIRQYDPTGEICPHF
jgi:hypothetical protein